VDGDRLWRIARVVEDFNLARLDKEKLEQTITDVNEGFTIAILFRGYGRAVRQLGDLVRIQDRKGDGMKGMFGHGGLVYLLSKHLRVALTETIFLASLPSGVHLGVAMSQSGRQFLDNCLRSCRNSSILGRPKYQEPW